jgi:hypothetical protein
VRSDRVGDALNVRSDRVGDIVYAAARLPHVGVSVRGSNSCLLCIAIVGYAAQTQREFGMF